MTWKLKCFETSGFQNSPQQIICSIFKDYIRGTRAALLLRHCSQLKYQCLRERMGCNNRWRQAEHMERALNHLSVTTACWRVLSSRSSNQPHWARDEAGFFFFLLPDEQEPELLHEYGSRCFKCLFALGPQLCAPRLVWMEAGASDPTGVTAVRGGVDTTAPGD